MFLLNEEHVYDHTRYNTTKKLQAEKDAYYAKLEKVFNIENFIKDGFSKVCDVDHYSRGRYSHKWFYKNINKELMFSSHSSWVYFIVVGSRIYKVGETGNPLGIEESYLYGDQELQPVSSTKCRLGRLRRGDGTDEYIRNSLSEKIASGVNVSIWAKACKISVLTETVAGSKLKVKMSSHKSIEKSYLEYFKESANRLPELNKATK